MKFRCKIIPDAPADAIEKEKPDLFNELLNNFTKASFVNTGANPVLCYIMARYLSMSPVGFDAAATYNDYANKLPAWARRPVLFHLVPRKGKPPYMKYVGGRKEQHTEKYEMAIERLRDHFSCKRNHAEQIYDILKAQGKQPEKVFGIE